MNYFKSMQMFNLFFVVTLYLCATYFFMNECRQFWTNKLEYFASFWNYIDILPPIGLYITLTSQFIPGFDPELCSVI
jgi:hypothetical protein